MNKLPLPVCVALSHRQPAPPPRLRAAAWEPTARRASRSPSATWRGSIKRRGPSSPESLSVETGGLAWIFILCLFIFSSTLKVDVFLLCFRDQVFLAELKSQEFCFCWVVHISSPHKHEGSMLQTAETQGFVACLFGNESIYKSQHG